MAAVPKARLISVEAAGRDKKWKPFSDLVRLYLEEANGGDDMMDLEDYAGRRIEVELEGERFRGRVVRGPARQPILLEERGPVGSERSDAHRKLSMLRTWTRRQLMEANLLQILPAVDKKPKKKKRKKVEWSETVALAEGDPAIPPRDWEGGLLAWAEIVHAARRKVERSRKAMMQALREAAG